MSKRLRSSDVCADCSAAEPSWASVNRGVLLCDECCSVHRSLGRHISQVRHLKHTAWPATLLQMVETLYNNGANSIWEHSLLDPASVMSGRRKAIPQDKVHPNKAEFIRAKYQMLAFVHRLPCRDDDSVTAKDLSKQLHSSVRTGNLETCLRLLSLGAQANFFHPEKGNSPLHVAAKTGQILQAELLAVYGADPGTPDSCGKTPVDYARQGGHHELAERLVEIQYELTDRLAFYLCGRKPDHKGRQHFIIPQMADSLDVSALAKAAKKKLQLLTNHLFEELAMDVYDEVDRRETDAVWLATQNHSTLVTETTVVPFLPVNPEYSSTRNQGRQKLARFNAHEFATLVIDILGDAKRRQQGNPVPSATGGWQRLSQQGPPLQGLLSLASENVELILKSVNCQPGPEADQPDYDSVASDEEGDLEASSGKASRQKEYLQVKNALVASEAKIQQLLKVNVNLSDELRTMQKKLVPRRSTQASFTQEVLLKPPSLGDIVGAAELSPALETWLPSSPLWSGGLNVALFKNEAKRVGRFHISFQFQTLQSENSSLRRQATPNPYPAPAGSEYADRPSVRRPSVRSSRPMSMYETGSAQKPYLPLAEASCPEEHTTPRLQLFHMSRLEKQSSLPEGDYDNTAPGLELDETGLIRKARQRSGLGPEGKDPEAHPSTGFPSTEDVIRKTEQITKNIQELLRAAQESKHESYVPCSERIHLAVTEMAALFPKKPPSELVRTPLRLLTSSAFRLHSECAKALPPESCSTADVQLVTQQVIQCAYDIAKAAKQLVTITTKENAN
ncbi:hypothetical protein Chor_012860 [Crotalus horridus]